LVLTKKAWSWSWSWKISEVLVLVLVLKQKSWSWSWKKSLIYISAPNWFGASSEPAPNKPA